MHLSIHPYICAHKGHAVGVGTHLLHPKSRDAYEGNVHFTRDRGFVCRLQQSFQKLFKLARKLGIFGELNKGLFWNRSLVLGGLRWAQKSVMNDGS